MSSKVLILQSHVSSYNIPVYNLLSRKVELTLAYTIANEADEDLPFKTLKLEYFNFCNFIFIKNNFRKLCNSFDVVIFMADLHYLSFWSLLLFRTNTKLIPWTIGIRASYKRLYSLTAKKGVIDLIYGTLLNRFDSVIFYMRQPIPFWQGIIYEEKIFVAHNTVDVLDNGPKQINNINSILFIGSLYKEKMIYELIEAYILAKKNINTKDFFTLNIVGMGEEYSNIELYIKEKKLTKSIFLLGPIYDEVKISKLFSKSILCISPNQAGLSVLKSMGYGVPFVTRENAITGGERLNIINKYNGILYNSSVELVEIISNAFLNKNEYIEMGRNAKEYYMSNATTKHMVNGFIDAINYSSKTLKRFKTIKNYG
jgi:glycosyltransferase involved in cell wall biosynthesis